MQNHLLLTPAQEAEFSQLRRDIHAHPELCFEELRTSELVAQKLTDCGFTVTRGLGKTGVVGTLRKGPLDALGKASAKSIGLRADMDALPIQEANTFAHRSQHAGKMHACGHDGHTAILLATAHLLAEQVEFNGTVHLIFQPAEEGGGGARAMIEEGLFTRFPCDMVFALHNWPGLETGKIAVRSGPIMASSNEFEITITGKGAHAAMPDQGIDPVLVGSQMVLALQSLVARNLKPTECGVVSVTQFHAGDTTNVIPNVARLAGTVRAFTPEVLDMLEQGMRRIVEHTAQSYGAQTEFQFHRNYPPTINHVAPSEFAAQVATELVGAEHVVRDLAPSMGAEDFSYMLQQVPGAYLRIGNGLGSHRVHDSSGNPGPGPCMLHNPSYDFNDALIPLGATLWAKLVERYLK